MTGRQLLVVATLLAAATLRHGAGLNVSPSGEAVNADGNNTVTWVLAQGAPSRISKACPFTYYDLWSLQAEYSEASGIWVARTPAGRMGIDGGLLALRDC